ncbi:MAG: rhodanese-like domain-containing protein [Thermincola sp.]|nr:rhodanese-like domain-containing protein [Thermincola sp.]MDT3703910.1 rhodanese-like domain-containing protein [Thermincola sp.]
MSRVSEIPKDKKVALVCQSGSRSSMAAEYLVQLGYNQVYNLDGGMMTWPYEVSKE